MFGTLPAYGFFIRHTRNIKLKDISLSFNDVDQRTVIKCNDVINAEINNVTAASTENSAPFFWLDNSKAIIISGCVPEQRIDTFLKAESCSEVFLIQNRLSRAKQNYELINTKRDDITEIANF